MKRRFRIFKIILFGRIVLCQNISKRIHKEALHKTIVYNKDLYQILMEKYTQDNYEQLIKLLNKNK